KVAMCKALTGAALAVKTYSRDCRMAPRYCFYPLGFDESDFYDREVTATPTTLLTELVPSVSIADRSEFEP
ncbi:MAG: hypothetical protein ACREX3_25935, partial [Gammaproteobacteria bacterium]